VFESGFQEYGAERRNPFLDPNHGVDNRLSVPDGGGSPFPVAFAHAYFREALMDGIIHSLAISFSHGIIPFGDLPSPFIGL
jgi:hypothetical protein